MKKILVALFCLSFLGLNASGCGCCDKCTCKEYSCSCTSSCTCGCANCAFER